MGPALKLLHLADLHLGKRVNEISMLEDQKYILGQILDLAQAEKSDAVLIAGDVYDKGVPPGDAVELLDEFLTRLARMGLPVLCIAGNHDSPERLGFGSRLFARSGLHIAGTFTGSVQHDTLRDAWGPVNFYLLPFVRPAAVAPCFPQETIRTCGDAVRAALAAAVSAPDFRPQERNVLLAHQFVTAGGNEPERSDSESVSVGGLDNVDASLFDAFDYVALGHLHGPQRIGRDTVRYAGSPLRYSFSEVRQHKSVPLVELGPKGTVGYRLLPLRPVREMRQIRGPLAALLEAGRALTEGREDYIRALLTDENETQVFDAVGQLRRVYPNLMRLEFENGGRGAQAQEDPAAEPEEMERLGPLGLFERFYRLQNGRGLAGGQQRILRGLLDRSEPAGEEGPQ